MDEQQLEHYSEQQALGYMTFKQIATELGLTKNTVQGQIYRYRGRTGRQEALESSWNETTKVDKLGNETTSFEVDGSTYAEIKDKSPEELLRFAGVDPDKFELTKSYFNQYGGKTSVRIEFRPLPDISNLTTEATKRMAEAMERVGMYFEFDPKVGEPDFEWEPTGRTMVVPLFDLHFGGSDTSYLTKRVLPWLTQIIRDQAPDEVNFILGGDLLQGEDEKGTTTSGTNTETPFNMVDASANLAAFIAGLYRILDHGSWNGNIHFINGNHAKYTEKAIMGALQAISPFDVIIHGDWMFYSDVNDTPIVAYHGSQLNKNRVKESQYLGFIRSEVPDFLAESLITRNPINVFTGHIHALKIEDIDGVRVNRVPMIPDHSEYEVANGLVGSVNRPMAFVFYHGMQSMTYTM